MIYMEKNVSSLSHRSTAIFSPSNSKSTFPTIKVSAASSFTLLSSDLRTWAAGTPLLLNLV